MESLTSVRQLHSVGRFAEALSALARTNIDRRDRLAADVLNAELLERTGRFTQRRALALLVLGTKDLTPGDRCSWDLIRARPEWQNANADSGIVHLQHAVT